MIRWHYSYHLYLDKVKKDCFKLLSDTFNLVFFHISTGKNCNLLFDTSSVVNDFREVKIEGGRNSNRLSCKCISSNQGQLYTPLPPKFSTDDPWFLDPRREMLFGIISGAGSWSNLFRERFNNFKLCICSMLGGISVKSLFETSSRVMACNDTLFQQTIAIKTDYI